MIKFYLATPQRERSAIILSVTFKGKQYRRTTKESTLVKFWNPQRQRVRVCRENRLANCTNDALELWCQAAQRAEVYFKKGYTIPSSRDFFEVVDEEYYKALERPVPSINTPESPSGYYSDYFERYIARYADARSIITIRHYRTVLNKLKQYEKMIRCRLQFEDININFYNQFRIWIYRQGYSDNYFGSLIKVIKQVYREAREVDHLHNLNGTAHKNFITVAKESDPVYLSVDELMKLYRLRITKNTVLNEWPDLCGEKAVRQRIATCELVRNRFLIGAFSGMRVSDFSRFSESNIVDGKIMMRTRKTDTPIAIPLHTVIQRILESDFDLSKTISDQKMNVYIKVVAKMAEIDEKVTICEHRGGEVKEIRVEKYALISTHTARRSFATHLQRSKVPLSSISMALGHKKVTTTMRYLRLGVDENAAILAGSSFFKDFEEDE